jgi:hypothetical protein
VPNLANTSFFSLTSLFLFFCFFSFRIYATTTQLFTTLDTERKRFIYDATQRQEKLPSSVVGVCVFVWHYSQHTTRKRTWDGTLYITLSTLTERQAELTQATMAQPLDMLLNQLNFRDPRWVKFDTQNLLSSVRSLSPVIGTLSMNANTYIQTHLIAHF